MRRLFNQREKNALYLAQDGKCAVCGKPLERGWHADHIDPHAKGGKTEIVNGQALCPDCNREKSDKMLNLRPAQQRMLTATQNRADELKQLDRPATPEEKAIVCDIAPGSGKTLGWQASVNWLAINGYIDGVIVLAPRMNLCQQAELDWKRDSKLFRPPMMGKITHETNKEPILPEHGRGAFGYATTYQSLVSQPDIHFSFAARNRIALVCDEADILGAEGMCEYGIEKSTQAAKKVSELAQLPSVFMVFVLSGTPYRQDGMPLLFARYTEKDKAGVRYLLPDVRASIQEGIRYSYLTQFEFELHNGTGVYEYLDGDIEHMQLSEMNGGLYKILTDEGYWKPFVDTVIDRLKEYQRIDPAYRGIIAAANQNHAVEIVEYIEKKYRHVKTLLAVSNEQLAHDNLRAFKRGHDDILVTVAMAHVGYDYKPIKVGGCLSTIRAEGWLTQLLFRAGRVLPDSVVPVDEQRMLWIVPDDPQMSEIVTKLRLESERGVKERSERNGGDGPGTARLGTTVDAEKTTARAMGMDEATDVGVNEFAMLRELTKKHAVPSVSLTGIKGLLLDCGVDMSKLTGQPPAPPAVHQSYDSQLTESNKKDILRSRIATMARGADIDIADAKGISKKHMSNFDWTQTYTAMKAQFGRGMSDKLSLEELESRLLWLERTWLPSLKKGR